MAWRPDRLDVVATRVGAATWLGAIPPQYLAPVPVSVWRHPLGWLRVGCRGLVLLTTDLAEVSRVLFECLGGLEAEDERHAAELRRTLTRPWPQPAVWACKRPRHDAWR